MTNSISRLERTQHKEKVATSTVSTYAIWPLNVKKLSPDQLTKLKEHARRLGADVWNHKGRVELLIPNGYSPGQSGRVYENVAAFLNTINPELSDSAMSDLDTSDD